MNAELWGIFIAFGLVIVIAGVAYLNAKAHPQE
jgi:uncharacterized protein YjeT (DUF2065 family)